MDDKHPANTAFRITPKLSQLNEINCNICGQRRRKANIVGDNNVGAWVTQAKRFRSSLHSLFCLDPKVTTDYRQYSYDNHIFRTTTKRKTQYSTSTQFQVLFKYYSSSQRRTINSELRSWTDKLNPTRHTNKYCSAQFRSKNALSEGA